MVTKCVVAGMRIGQDMSNERLCCSILSTYISVSEKCTYVMSLSLSQMNCHIPNDVKLVLCIWPVIQAQESLIDQTPQFQPWIRSISKEVMGPFLLSFLWTWPGIKHRSYWSNSKFVWPQRPSSSTIANRRHFCWGHYEAFSLPPKMEMGVKLPPRQPQFKEI